VFVYNHASQFLAMTQRRQVRTCVPASSKPRWKFLPRATDLTPGNSGKPGSLGASLVTETSQLPVLPRTEMWVETFLAVASGRTRPYHCQSTLVSSNPFNGDRSNNLPFPAAVQVRSFNPVNARRAKYLSNFP